jgi:hypothetical protein
MEQREELASGEQAVPDHPNLLDIAILGQGILDDAQDAILRLRERLRNTTRDVRPKKGNGRRDDLKRGNERPGKPRNPAT